MSHHYFKIVWRFLNNNKGTSFINTIGLAVILLSLLLAISGNGMVKRFPTRP